MSDPAPGPRYADDKEYAAAFVTALGVTLRRRRRARGLTHVQVAARIGFSTPAAIGHHENAARSVAVSVLVRYARIYRTTPAELMHEASFLVATLPPRHRGDVHLGAVAASRAPALEPLRAWAAVQLDTLAVSPGTILRLDRTTIPPLSYLCGITPAELVDTLTTECGPEVHSG